MGWMAKALLLDSLLGQESFLFEIVQTALRPT
jgi:hypothetical protein